LEEEEPPPVDVTHGVHLPDAMLHLNGNWQSGSRVHLNAQAWSFGPKPTGGVVKNSWQT
jgi:hypothetical protein